MPAQTYTQRAGFFLAMLDSIDQEIAVIQKDGQIIYVNDAWVRFGSSNSLAGENWLGSNYLNVCASSDEAGEPEVHEIYEGIASVIAGRTDSFSHEYPCHSPTEKRWFTMTIVGMVGYEKELFVITHSNITQRKLIEAQVESLSLHDFLTGLPNRRNFELFMNIEWHRNRRERSPISLIMIDIDHFKALNDKYGHSIGDECLKAISSIVGSAARRASDLAVRWGGEEFFLIMGNTTVQAAVEIADQIRLSVAEIESSDFGKCSISAGVASVIPDTDDYKKLISDADTALYMAKDRGRNRVVEFAR